MAGFGNRDTDVESYLAVGVPASRIFIINPKGELRKPSTAVSTSSLRTLSALTALVDALFPAVPASQGVPLPTSTLTVGHLPGAGTTPGGSPRLAGSVTGSESDAWGEGGSFNGGVSVFGAGMEGGAPHQRRGREDTPARDEFNSFNYWRIQTSYVVDDEEDLFEDALGGPDGDGDGGGVIENDGKAGSNGAEGGDGSSNMKAA